MPLDDDEFWSLVLGPREREPDLPRLGIAWPCFAAELLELYEAGGAARATIIKARQVLREFGSLPGVRATVDLTPANVARYAARLSGRAPATITGLMSYLRAAAGYAERLGYLHVNPFQAWKRYTPPPTAAPARRRSEPYHAPDAIGRVLDHLARRIADWETHRLYALAATVAYTGLRRDEALYLPLHRVDLGQRLLVIAPTEQRRLKRPSAERLVPMPDALHQVLESWVPRSGPYWTFPGVTRSGPWRGGMPGRKPLDRLKAAGEAVGVSGFTFQSLRHSWTTNASYYWQLADLEIQAVLGHTTTRTQAHYRRTRRALPLIRERVRSIAFKTAAGG